MNDRQRLAELEKLSRNTFSYGNVISFDAESKQAIVNIELATGTIPSQPLIVMGREEMLEGEPVLVILPTAIPSFGYVFGLLTDPKLMQLSDSIDKLKQQIAPLEQQ